MLVFVRPGHGLPSIRRWLVIPQTELINFVYGYFAFERKTTLTDFALALALLILVLLCENVREVHLFDGVGLITDHRRALSVPCM